MYNEYFGFHESPFSVTPDPRFFYANPVYLEAYANLRYGVDAKKGFIVVTGEVGTGKTTLLRKLMRDFKSTVHFASIFNTDVSFNDLLRVTLRELDVPTKGKDRLGMVEELNTYLIEQLERRQIVCLLIDEAQNLTDESLERLRLLSNLETDKQKLLQIVLVGQPELSVKLDKPMLRQLKQRIAIRCKIAPLTDDEVGSYVSFRLGVAGYEGKNLFAPEALRKIALYSKGIPRLINIICDNALVIAFAASQKKVSAQVIREVASDLRLAAEVQPATANNAGALSPFNSEPDVPAKAANGIPQNTLRRLGAGTVLVILFCITAVFVYQPESFFTPKVNLNASSDQRFRSSPPKKSCRKRPSSCDTAPRCTKLPVTSMERMLFSVWILSKSSIRKYGTLTRSQQGRNSCCRLSRWKHCRDRNRMVRIV